MSARKRVATSAFPTLSLYRRILRAHQTVLPPAHRELGDAYVKEEFRLHRGASVCKLAICLLRAAACGSSITESRHCVCLG